MDWLNRMLRFKIQTNDPKTHIEACSIVDYFRCKILDEKIGESGETFYGEFFLEGNEECFDIFSGFPGISTFMDPTNTVR